MNHLLLTLPSISKLVAVLLAVQVAPDSSSPQGGGSGDVAETISVNLKLTTGGAMSGPVVDHDETGIVLVQGQAPARPFVFAWEEVEPASAILAKRQLLALKRGGRESLLAEDHYHLGLFALSRNRIPAARAAFRKAVQLDESYAARTKAALDGHRAESQRRDDHRLSPGREKPPRIDDEPRPDLPSLIESGTRRGDNSSKPVEDREDVRNRVRAVYDTFALTVRDVMGKDVERIETDHFLIFTDWRERDRQKLAAWFEAMYSALCEKFACEAGEDIFLAKCPVFCWASKAKFWKFARLFDGFEDKNAIGYTRSIESSGHVHMVLCLGGRSEADFDRFTYTLVHEGTHAFIHRFHSNRLIPHWVNEGYAELMAEQILGDRCPAGEKADLLAKQFERYDWPLGNLLHHAGPIEIQQYPIAASIVTYLDSLGPEQFAGFVRSIKNGQALPQALADNYAGMSVAELEARWRGWVRERNAGAGFSE